MLIGKLLWYQNKFNEEVLSSNLFTWICISHLYLYLSRLINVTSSSIFHMRGCIRASTVFERFGDSNLNLHAIVWLELCYPLSKLSKLPCSLFLYLIVFQYIVTLIFTVVFFVQRLSSTRVCNKRSIDTKSRYIQFWCPPCGNS